MLRPSSRPWVARVALALVALPLAVNAATGPYLTFAVPAAADIPASTPPAARASIEDGERLIGVLLTGFGLLGLVVAGVHHARPSTGTLAGLLVVGATFAGITALMAFRGGSLTTFYGVQTVLIAVGIGLYAATRRGAAETEAASPT